MFEESGSDFEGGGVKSQEERLKNTDKPSIHRRGYDQKLLPHIHWSGSFVIEERGLFTLQNYRFLMLRVGGAWSGLSGQKCLG